MTAGGLDGNTHADGDDIVLVKFDGNGTKVWTKQLGTNADESGKGVACIARGKVYVTGNTLGDLDGNTQQGSGDRFLAVFR